MSLLAVHDLVVKFRSRDQTVHAVNRVSFQLGEGRTLGLVGESGSGKTVTGLSIMRLLPSNGHVDSGRILFQGLNVLDLPQQEMRALRGKEIGMVFQDPMTSLNPVVNIGSQLRESFSAHASGSGPQLERQCINSLDAVGIPGGGTALRRYPHEFSGGMRQRVMLAIALAQAPKLLIADEPTTALDVTVQAQVLDLIRQLTRVHGTAVILITHDMGVVATMAEDVAVMYAGRMVEIATTEELFDRPRHPYTVGLLRSLPQIGNKGSPLVPIDGSPPDQTDDAPGCAFAARCAWARPVCRSSEPLLEDVAVGETILAGRSHLVACHAWASDEKSRIERPTGSSPVVSRANA